MPNITVAAVLKVEFGNSKGKYCLYSFLYPVTSIICFLLSVSGVSISFYPAIGEKSRSKYGDASHTATSSLRGHSTEMIFFLILQNSLNLYLTLITNYFYTKHL